jgi:hypothetical protein
MAERVPVTKEREYASLYGDYCLAINDSYKKLIWYGMESREFREANARANSLRAQMGSIQEAGVRENARAD